MGILLAPGQMRLGTGGEVLWCGWHRNWPGVSHGGLLRSGGMIPPQPSCGPNLSNPLREQTRQGQGVDRLGAEAGPSRLGSVEMRRGVHSHHLPPELREGGRRAWPPCSVMMHSMRRRTLMRTAALCPDPAPWIGCLLSLLSSRQPFLMGTGARRRIALPLSRRV